MKIKYAFLAFIIISLMMTSCNLFDSNNENARIVIENNNNNLNGRIITTDEEIELDSLTGALGKYSMVSVPQDFRLILRAEVNPPVFDGFTLRASHVTINDDVAYVTYNREGEDYLGGVEIFDISDIENPELISQAIFKDTDISSVAYSDNKLYLAGATNPDLHTELKSPAILEKMNLNLFGELSTSTSQYDVSSYVATDVFVYKDILLATTGSDGDLLFFNKDNMDSLGAYPVHDARNVGLTDDYFVFLSASPANLHVVSTTSSDIITYPIAGETIPESKSTLAIDGEYAYVALNDAGLKVIKLSDGSLVQEIPRPDTPEGEDDLDYVTNGVSINDDLVFIANGAAGVYVGRKYDGEDIEIYGSATFNSSTNFVVSKDDVVFVATGYGGFKILEVQRYGFSGTELTTNHGSADFSSKYAAVRFKSFSNSTREEIYLGVDDIAKSGNRSQDHYEWTVPGEHDIVFSYDPTTHELHASINGNELELSYPATAPAEEINILQLDVIGQTKDVSVILKNVFINDSPVGSFEGNGWKTWNISGFDVSSGFKLRGILEISGDFGSSNETDKVNILLGHSDLEDTDE